MKHTNLYLSCLFILVIACGCKSMGISLTTIDGEAPFPAAPANYQPKKQYAVGFDNMWKHVKQVLEAERIAVVSTDKEEGRMTTDSVAGASKPVMGGVIGRLPTRYRYTLTVNKQAPDSCTLNIMCKLECGDAHGGWVDTTREERAQVESLENWLYSKIESTPF